MNKLKTILFSGVILCLLFFGVIMIVKYSRLKTENLELRLQIENNMDSLRKESEMLLDTVDILNIRLNECNMIIDSLLNVKQKVIIKTEYVTSENLMDGVVILRDNLWKK